MLRPQYFVFELYANLLKETVLDVWKEDVPTRSGCIRDDVKTVDTADIVITYDGKTYAAAAVNKDPENEQPLELCFTENASGPGPEALFLIFKGSLKPPRSLPA